MIVAGFGFRGSAGADSLTDALALTGTKPDVLATAADKAASAPFQSFAKKQSLPVAAIAAPDLHAQDTITQSDASAAARGTGSVAEAAALAAAGRNARLVIGRVVSHDRLATCAIAEGDGP
ncbi:cobalamin biosynthesis protein [Gymnodinialimonas sp. 2305UL16-5]|uniref:cobalamin biosynthesis protein n=1 Tax=Gymnodinialimonas mytili TaxID=3126503 RepID=UPI00309EB20B